MNVIQCCIMFGWTYLMFLSFLFTQMISDRTTWRRYVQFTYWWELVVRWAGPFLTLSFVFAPSDEDTDNCMLFFHQPFLFFRWFLVDELGSIGDANLSSSLAVCWHKNVRHDVVASRCLRPCWRRARRCFRRWWKQAYSWLIKGGLHPASHQNPSLSLGKAQC
jgi:hypothetical protein